MLLFRTPKSMVIPGQPSALIAWCVIFTVPAARLTLLMVPCAMKPWVAPAAADMPPMPPASIVPMPGIAFDAAKAGDMAAAEPIRTRARSKRFIEFSCVVNDVCGWICATARRRREAASPAHGPKGRAPRGSLLLHQESINPPAILRIAQSGFLNQLAVLAKAGLNLRRPGLDSIVTRGKRRIGGAQHQQGCDDDQQFFHGNSPDD